MKDILTLQLNTLPLDSGTTMFEEVEAIAYSCPYLHGKAVYYARAVNILLKYNIPTNRNKLNYL